MSSALIGVLVTTAVVAWAGTAVTRRYAQARLLDMPNKRSSHTVATPRGGGVAIVVAASAGLVWAGLPTAVVGGALLVALIGLIDDHHFVDVLPRLAGHFGAAIIAVLGLEGPVHPAAVLIAVFFIAWQINLTNFMDGIDGLASVQVISVCVVGAGVAWSVTGGYGSVVTAPLVLAAATGGFLVWNWPPARIFLGDVGSGYLGYLIGLFTLHAALHDARLGWAWVILSGVFVTDTGVTLLRRAWSGQQLHVAHRSHAYQHLANRLGRHAPVTGAVAAVNVGLLAPIAYLVATGALGVVAGLVMSYAPLLAVAWTSGAGVPSRLPAGQTSHDPFQQTPA